MSQVSQIIVPYPCYLPFKKKRLEKVMAEQLVDYCTTNNIFCIQQFGFRPGHSTELAALNLANHLITEMDNFKVLSIFILICHKHLTF